MISSQEHPLSVSDLTQSIRGILEGEFSRLYVEAEVSGWRPYPSGHVYFTLKDPGATISAVMFNSYFQKCEARERIKDGVKVLVYGTVSIYPSTSRYQIKVFALKLVGEGDLMRRYLELKAKLEAEGLFDAARKRPLPFLPRRIGLVTSPSGAVIHDMCRVFLRRFPAVELRLFPAAVQGSDAPQSLRAGLDYFNSLVGSDWSPDLVIIGRGGGSFEDLFCFNDEDLVRDVARMKVPVVSAVGHESDVTLCDFAADARAGTPSMAAELVVPRLADLRRTVSTASASLASLLRGAYEYHAQKVDHLGSSLAAALRLYLTRATAAVSEASVKLALLSPYAVLDRGYSLTTDEAGAVVRSASAVPAGSVILTRLKDGTLKSVTC